MNKDLGIIIAAAGSSSRFGNRDKLFEKLDGIPLFLHSVRNLYHLCLPGNMIVVVNPAKLEDFQSAAATYTPECSLKFIPGAELRADSVRNGLAALAPETKFVAIHDAARPWAEPELLSECLIEARLHGGAVPAKAVVDTLKLADEDGKIIKTVSRNNLWRVETPQVFNLEQLRDANDQALKKKTEFTDDASIMEAAGYKVYIVESPGKNDKITYDKDMVIEGTIISGGKVDPDLAAAPEFPVQPLDMEKIKDGIIVRVPNWLGDVVMTIPALMQLKRMLPEYCGLFVICTEGARKLLESLTIIDYVIVLEKAHRNWSRRDLRNVFQLRAGAGILFNNSLRDTIFMRLAGISNLYGARARGRTSLLARSFAFPARTSATLNNLHHANKYLSIVKALGASDWDGTLPEFKMEYALCQAGSEVRALCSHAKLMTIAAGAAYGSSKRWDAEKFGEVAKWWIKKGGMVAVLGTEKEKDIAARVVENLPSGRAYNMAGKTDMCELIYLLFNSQICVANDSGIMHLAAILGRPGVAIFGPTDYSATGPISEHWRIVYKKRECSPCFKRECPYGPNECMRAYSSSHVIHEVSELLGMEEEDEQISLNISS
jgi:lipopolysaccharide heptosyltransferase II